MELWKYLKSSDKPIVLYGMGNGADRILDELSARDISAAGVFASDGFVRHQRFRGFTVESYQELKERFGEMTVLLAFGTHRPDVIENVQRIMAEQEVYAPDIPIAGKAMFDEKFLSEHYKELEQVYIMLSDAQSKKVFENVIRSKLTGEISPLLECVTEPKEAYERLGLHGGESYLDIGAYNGDTVQRFLDWTNRSYCRIDAIEPDYKNYRKLLDCTSGFPNIYCYNLCMDEVVGSCMFAMDGGRKSRALSSGVSVTAETVDHLFEKNAISLIKMDVEGMEQSVIKGAAQTIFRCKPRMDIAAYHRADDLFSIPLLMQKLQSGFHLYLRRFLSLPAWDTNFYFTWE